MLKLSTKRTHNLIDAPPPCAPHRIHFLSSPVKRVRPAHEDVGTSGSTGTSSMETVVAADAPSPPASPPAVSTSTSSSSSSVTPFSFTFPPSPRPSTSSSPSSSSASHFAFPFPTSSIPSNSTQGSSSSAPQATPFTFAFPSSSSSSDSPSTSGSTSQPTSPLALTGRKHYRVESRFVPKNRFDPNDVIRFAPRKKLRKIAQGEKGPMFTLEEVKALVAQVVAQREATVREEFEQTLEARLQEQFSQFSQFNRDYIDRQISSSEYSYLS